VSFDFNDFGFTTIDESELEAVQNLEAENQNAKSELASNLEDMYNSILPLLENLKGDPKKDYIYWPAEKRVQVIESFKEQKLKSILNKAGIDIK